MNMSWLGLFLTVISGVMAGSFSLPMKKTIRWAWENTWLVWAFTALLILPWALAFITVPHLFSVYSGVPADTLLMVWFFGLGWGLGAVLFGQGIALIGMSLAFAISIGLTTAVGALVPMLRSPAQFLTASGGTVAAGIVLMVFGVFLCARAGGMKEARLKTSTDGGCPANSVSKAAFAKGLLFCILSGVFNSMINFAFAFGGKISDSAAQAGASAGALADPIWALALFGGFAANLGYCTFLLFKNRTWKKYSEAGIRSHWPLAALMGALWFFSLVVYGRGALLMGSLGASAGWGIYMGLCVLVSNCWGVFSGEWKEGKGKPLGVMIAGQALLLAAIILIGIGNTLG